MSAPITWRNVGSDTGSPAQISQIFDSANRGFAGGLTALGSILDKSQGVQDRNVLALDEAAKQAYLNQLQGAKTPEELAALQASGALDNARAGLSVASQAAVRGADDARTTALRSNLTAAQTFGDQQVDRGDEVVKQQAAALTAKGDLAGAKALLDAHTLRKGAADLYAGIHTTERARLGEAHADTTYQQGQDDRTHMLTMRPFADNNTRNSSEISNLDLTEKKRNLTEAERQRQQEAQVSDFATNHLETTRAMRQSIDSGLVDLTLPKTAEGFPGVLPRNSDGTLAIDRMDSPTKKLVDDHLAKKGLPSLDAVVGNDTAAAATLRSNLRNTPGFKATDVQRLDPVIGAALSTSAPAPIGQEADVAARTMRQLQAEEAQVNGQFGTVTSQGDKAELLKTGIDALSNVSTGLFGSAGRARAGLSKWLDKGGIPVGNTGERVLPSAGQLSLILSQLPNNWLYNREGEIENALDKWAKSDEAQAGAAQVIKVRDRNRLLGIDPLGKK